MWKKDLVIRHMITACFSTLLEQWAQLSLTTVSHADRTQVGSLKLITTTFSWILWRVCICTVKQKDRREERKQRMTRRKTSMLFPPQLCFSCHVHVSNLQDREAPPGVCFCGILTPWQVRFEHIPSVFPNAMLSSIQLCAWELRITSTLWAPTYSID